MQIQIPNQCNKLLDPTINDLKKAISLPATTFNLNLHAHDWKLLKHIHKTNLGKSQTNQYGGEVNINNSDVDLPTSTKLQLIYAEEELANLKSMSNTGQSDLSIESLKAFISKLHEITFTAPVDMTVVCTITYMDQLHDLYYSTNTDSFQWTIKNANATQANEKIIINYVFDYARVLTIQAIKTAIHILNTTIPQAVPIVFECINNNTKHLQQCQTTNPICNMVAKQGVFYADLYNEENLDRRDEVSKLENRNPYMANYNSIIEQENATQGCNNDVQRMISKYVQYSKEFNTAFQFHYKYQLPLSIEMIDMLETLCKMALTREQLNTYTANNNTAEKGYVFHGTAHPIHPIHPIHKSLSILSFLSVSSAYELAATYGNHIYVFKIDDLNDSKLIHMHNPHECEFLLPPGYTFHIVETETIRLEMSSQLTFYMCTKSVYAPLKPTRDPTIVNDNDIFAPCMKMMITEMSNDTILMYDDNKLGLKPGVPDEAIPTRDKKDTNGMKLFDAIMFHKGGMRNFYTKVPSLLDLETTLDLVQCLIKECESRGFVRGVDDVHSDIEESFQQFFAYMRQCLAYLRTHPGKGGKNKTNKKQCKCRRITLIH